MLEKSSHLDDGGIGSGGNGDGDMEDGVSGGGGRTIGLFGATGIGVGAIVGGGILALAGVAFAETGPSAILAFLLNGVIAIITAISFAELASRFPESGGTYTFAKRVLSVEAAFTVGWVVWFASIVAAVLYAVGFGAFGMLVVKEVILLGGGEVSEWLTGRWMVTGVGVCATGYYMWQHSRRAGGGGQMVNVVKVLVFAILLGGGFWALFMGGGEDGSRGGVGSVGEKMSPFFAGGFVGLITAMGYTFIALQGFDLIAAVGGEVKNPKRNLPRAMLASLGIALLIYIPLLFVSATAGVEEGKSITALSKADSEATIPLTARKYLGETGYWLVLCAGVLAMLSALSANLFAASRVAMAMAKDRTLPAILEKLHLGRNTPMYAVTATGGLVVVMLVVLGDVATAGAAASLIFLVTFALAHWISILARRRAGVRGHRHGGFEAPWFPLFAVVGGLACLGLAIFQGVSVPSAGIVASIWLGGGVGLYLFLFARRARVRDAAAEGYDPNLMIMRGRSPLVLVPIANPSHASAMVGVANALAPPLVGRVVLLNVVVAERDEEGIETGHEAALDSAQRVLGASLAASMKRGLYPEALTTIGPEPWYEISRVARARQCESLLLGLSDLSKPAAGSRLEALMSEVDCDVVVLRGLGDWRLKHVRRVLVPIGGRGGHDELRARLLGSARRMGNREITYMRVLPAWASDLAVAKARENLSALAYEETGTHCEVRIERSDEVYETVVGLARESDLVILGMRRISRRHKVIGEIALRIARGTDCGLILISKRG